MKQKIRPVGINSRIWHVIARLEDRAIREKSGESGVEQEDAMLAITLDTGIFFNIMLKAMGAARILEIGTSTGYSTLWFADALLATSQRNLSKYNEQQIITIDFDHSKVVRSNTNFKEAGVKNMIRIIEGKAKCILSQLQTVPPIELIGQDNDKRFDFVFMDADKESLIDYFRLVLPLVKVGGVIAADNMLFPEEFRPRMKKYANYVRGMPNIESVMVPIGNGEEISYKLY